MYQFKKQLITLALIGLATTSAFAQGFGRYTVDKSNNETWQVRFEFHRTVRVVKCGGVVPYVQYKITGNFGNSLGVRKGQYMIGQMPNGNWTTLSGAFRC